MEEKKLVPKLRFPGFTEPWEQRKLGEMASFSKGNGYFKSDLKSTGIPIILYGRLYTKYETVIKDIDTFADAKEGAVYSLGGEVIVPASGETAEDISIASVVQNPGVLLGGDLNIIRPIENLLPAFLALSISNGSSHREMSKRAQGKSVVHLHNEDLAQIDLKYPSVEEQSKITVCINWIDTLITLHQRKLEHLKLKKKSLLQKLFPKEGEVYPELRFPGFTAPWEQRKLGELVTVFSGQDYKHLSEGDIPVYGTGGYMLSVNEALSNDQDAIGIGRKGTIDKPYILKAPFWTVDTLFYAIPKEKMDLNFIFCIFKNVDWRKLDESTGVPSLSKSTITNVDVYCPFFEEQLLIGRFFSWIDSSITLHQRKLEHLQLLKKALLQQLFV